MNILIVSQYFWPESVRINEMVKALRATGAAVTVLTGQPNYPDGAIFPGYSAMSTGLEEDTHGTPVYRVPLIPRGRASRFRLAANYASFAISATVFGAWLLRGRQVDVIFVYAPSPLLQALPGMFLKRLKKAPLVTWVQDLWPESLVATGSVTNESLLQMVKKLVVWIYRDSDLVLAQSRSFVKSITELAGNTPVEYFPNPGEDAFRTAEPRPGPALILQPAFNVVFTGNLGSVQALDTLVRAAELLRSHTDVRFVIIGSGSRAGWLAHEVAAKGLDNVSLPGRFPPDAMPGIMAQASALLVSLIRSPIMSQTIPSKVQAYLAAGKPIVAALDGEGAAVVLEAGAGLACPAEDPRALAELVLRLKAMSEAERRRMGQAGQRYYAGHFDAAVLARRLVDRLEHLRATAVTPSLSAAT